MTKKLNAYFVRELDNFECILVFAKCTKEAKKVAFSSGWFYEYIDMRVKKAGREEKYLYYYANPLKLKESNAHYIDYFPNCESCKGYFFEVIDGLCSDCGLYPGEALLNLYKNKIDMEY